jgi:hypothetical protein
MPTLASVPRGRNWSLSLFPKIGIRPDDQRVLASRVPFGGVVCPQITLDRTRPAAKLAADGRDQTTQRRFHRRRQLRHR